MKQLCKYWGDNLLKAVEGKELSATLLAAALIVITWLSHKKDLISIETQEQIIIGIVFLRFIAWIPFKRHKEQELNCQTALNDKQNGHAIIIQDLNTTHSQEVAGLKNEIQKYKEEKERDAQVFVTAVMMIDNSRQYKPTIVKIKVVNKTDKKIWVEKVSLLLQPHIADMGGVRAMMSDLSVRAGPLTTVEIDSGGKSAYWVLDAHNQLILKKIQIDNKWYGKGQVELSDDRSPIEFTFLTID